MSAPLQIKPKDCSPLGLLILQHMQDHQVSMNALAKQSGITQPGLRAACLKGTNPTESTLKKLSKVLGKHPLELYFLAYGDRIKELQEEANDNYLESLFREIFDILKHAGLVSAKSRPPKMAITNAFRKALKDLGIGSDEQGV